METILVSTAGEAVIFADAKVDVIAAAGGDVVNTEEGMMTETMAAPGMKDPLLSSWPFVIGISAAVLAISIVIGVLLAKRKIKKGIELYED
jgi:hypothetical protein